MLALKLDSYSPKIIGLWAWDTTGVHGAVDVTLSLVNATQARYQLSCIPGPELFYLRCSKIKRIMLQPTTWLDKWEFGWDKPAPW